MPLDRGAVEELRVGRDGRDRRELVDGDALRRRRAEDRQEREPVVVAAIRPGFRSAALRDQVEHGSRRGGAGTELECALRLRLRLAQSGGLGRGRREERYGRPRDRLPAGLYATSDRAKGQACETIRQKGNDDQDESSPVPERSHAPPPEKRGGGLPAAPVSLLQLDL